MKGSMVQCRAASRVRLLRARGFTLVEALMAVLIVSGVLVASLGTFGAIGRARQLELERAQALGLAERVMAEIVQCRYEEPSASTTTLGPDAGESGRAQYDDVDDYDSWSTAPPEGRDGVALVGMTGWSVQVWVRWVNPSDPATTTNTPSGLKRIQMRVTTPVGLRHEFVSLRSSGGAYEHVPTGIMNYLTWAGVAVKVHEQGRTVYGGAHPLNVTTNQ
jgi:type II secretory pathway pseudopilin PulG